MRRKQKKWYDIIVWFDWLRFETPENPGICFTMFRVSSVAYSFYPAVRRSTSILVPRLSETTTVLHAETFMLWRRRRLQNLSNTRAFSCLSPVFSFREDRRRNTAMAFVVLLSSHFLAAVQLATKLSTISCFFALCCLWCAMFAWTFESSRSRLTLQGNKRYWDSIVPPSSTPS